MRSRTCAINPRFDFKARPSTYTFPTPLADGTYHWRVKSVGAGSLESSFSATDTFVIIPAFGPWTVPLLALAMIAYMIWYNPKRPAA